MASVEDTLNKLQQTKALMVRNMELLLTRGDQLDALNDKTATLEQKAKLYADAARSLQERAKSRYFAVTFILIGVSIGTIYTIVSGFSMPIVATGAMAGGALGYTVNFLRNWFVETFFPKPIDKKPTANITEPPRGGKASDLESTLEAQRSFISGFNPRSGKSVTSSVAEAALKAKLGL